MGLCEACHHDAPSRLRVEVAKLKAENVELKAENDKLKSKRHIALTQAQEQALFDVAKSRKRRHWENIIAENAKLKERALYVIRDECWGSQVRDGGTVQDLAEQLGLIVKDTEKNADGKQGYGRAARHHRAVQVLRGTVRFRRGGSVHRRIVGVEVGERRNGNGHAGRVLGMLSQRVCALCRVRESRG